MNNKIVIGCDHGGYKLKDTIMQHLMETGFDIEDAGCFTEDSCDYPVIGHKVAKKVSESKCRGILICGSGIGMSIVANRYPGIRASLCHDAYTAEMTRKHNNSNILVLGGRVIGVGVALSIVNIWINTDFEGGRHQKRLDLIDKNIIR